MEIMWSQPNQPNLRSNLYHQLIMICIQVNMSNKYIKQICQYQYALVIILNTISQEHPFINLCAYCLYPFYPYNLILTMRQQPIAVNPHSTLLLHSPTCKISINHSQTMLILERLQESLPVNKYSCSLVSQQTPKEAHEQLKSLYEAIENQQNVAIHYGKLSATLCIKYKPRNQQQSITKYLLLKEQPVGVLQLVSQITALKKKNEEIQAILDHKASVIQLDKAIQKLEEKVRNLQQKNMNRNISRNQQSKNSTIYWTQETVLQHDHERTVYKQVFGKIIAKIISIKKQGEILSLEICIQMINSPLYQEYFKIQDNIEMEQLHSLNIDSFKGLLSFLTESRCQVVMQEHKRITISFEHLFSNQKFEISLQEKGFYYQDRLEYRLDYLESLTDWDEKLQQKKIMNYFSIDNKQQNLELKKLSQKIVELEKMMKTKNEKNSEMITTFLDSQKKVMETHKKEMNSQKYALQKHISSLQAHKKECKSSLSSTFAALNKKISYVEKELFELLKTAKSDEQQTFIRQQPQRKWKYRPQNQPFKRTKKQSQKQIIGTYINPLSTYRQNFTINWPEIQYIGQKEPTMLVMNTLENMKTHKQNKYVFRIEIEESSNQNIGVGLIHVKHCSSRNCLRQSVCFDLRSRSILKDNLVDKKYQDIVNKIKTITMTIILSTCQIKWSSGFGQSIECFDQRLESGRENWCPFIRMENKGDKVKVENVVDQSQNNQCNPQ